MPLQCEVELQHPASGVTFDNSYISGFVKFTVEKPTKVSGVTVAVRGKGYCSWSETTGVGKNRRTIRYSNNEEYLNGSTHLMQPTYGQGQLVIEPGIYNFPFNIYIPPGVPSSFEHTGGYIRYKLQVRFWRPWKKDFRFDRRFNVYSHIDLNLNPALRNPALGELKKKFYTLVVKNGEMDIEIRTVASAFVPGQVIPLHCAFRNDSSVKIKYIKISLKQFIMYTSSIGKVHHFPPITVVKNVVNTEPDQDQSVFESQLTVPSTARTSLLSSKIICINYKLMVKVKVSGLHVSPVVTLPLVIGTIPLYNIPGTSAPLQSVPGFLENPPSYSQATQEKQESSDDEDLGEKK